MSSYVVQSQCLDLTHLSTISKQTRVCFLVSCVGKSVRDNGGGRVCERIVINNIVN